MPRICLINPTDDQDHQQVIQTIIKNTERAASTVNDLLTFTRQGPLVEIPLNLADVIAESLIFVHAKIKARKIIIRKEIPSSGAMVCGDERQLMQLMVNLLLNSIQVLSSNGYIVIRVKKQTALSGEEILLEVGRQWAWNKSLGFKKNIRSLLHHQGNRFRSGAFHLPYHCGASSRDYLGRVRTGRRHYDACDVAGPLCGIGSGHRR